MLNNILEREINFFDTARSYGSSEERIGKIFKKKRDQIIISTKIGDGIEGFSDWTYDSIKEGLNISLGKLQTDYIDIVHLHSYNLEILKNGDVIKALTDSKKEGKIRLVAYSGENQELEFSLINDIFEVIQISINIFDQRGIDNYLKIADENKIGVIAKRPIANAPWRYDERPVGNYCEEYWQRMKKMNLKIDKYELQQLALRFCVFTKGVSTAIVGTKNLQHLDENIKIISKGKLDDQIYSNIRKSFKINDNNWIGQI